MVKKIQNGKVGFRTLLIGDTKNIQNVFQEIINKGYHDDAWDICENYGVLKPPDTYL